MKARVLITRAQPGADVMAAFLKTAGYQTRIESVMHTEALSVDLPGPGLAKISTFVFVSPAAVRFANKLVRYLTDLENPEIYAVGPETKRQLLQQGLSSKCPELANSEGLLALDGLQRVKGRNILIVCGRGGRVTLQTQLQNRGAKVSRAEVYQRLPSPIALQDTRELDAVIISSGEGLQLFLQATSDLPNRVPFLLPSGRIAEQAKAAGVKQSIVCDGASSEAVLNALDTLFSCA